MAVATILATPAIPPRKSTTALGTPQSCHFFLASSSAGQKAGQVLGGFLDLLGIETKATGHLVHLGIVRRANGDLTGCVEIDAAAKLNCKAGRHGLLLRGQTWQ